MKENEITRIAEQNDTNQLEAFVNDVSNNIAKVFDEQEALNGKVSKQNAIGELKNLYANIKDLGSSIRYGKLKLISYLLTLSILISIPVSSFLGIRKKTLYKTVYPTQEVIYDTKANYKYESGYYHGQIIVGNALKYDLEYLEFNPTGENGYILDENGHNCYYQIVEKTQWEIIGREAVREVRSCIIPLSDLGRVINTDDFNTLFVTYNGDVQKNVILKSDVPRSDRIFYAEEENQGKKTYEVIRYDQDLNNPRLVEVAKDYSQLYAILLCELLVWICIVEWNNSSLIEGVINTTRKLIDDKKVAEVEGAKLTKLYDECVKIYEPNKQKKIRRRKK